MRSFSRRLSTFNVNIHDGVFFHRFNSRETIMNNHVMTKLFKVHFFCKYWKTLYLLSNYWIIWILAATQFTRKLILIGDEEKNDTKFEANLLMVNDQQPSCGNEPINLPLSISCSYVINYWTRYVSAMCVALVLFCSPLALSCKISNWDSISIAYEYSWQIIA